MATPITWKNIAAPDYSGAMRGVELAKDSLTGGLTQLQGAVRQVEDVDEENWQAEKRNNTQSFLQKIHEAKGVDGFKALEDSGELDQMVKGFGAQFDAERGREVRDNRLGVLQGRETADWAHGDAKRTHDEAGLRSQYTQALLSGDKELAASLSAQMSQQTQGALAKEQDARGQEVIDRDRAGDRHAWDRNRDIRAGQTTDSTLKTSALNRRVAMSRHEMEVHRFNLEKAAGEEDKEVTDLERAAAIRDAALAEEEAKEAALKKQAVEEFTGIGAKYRQVQGDSLILAAELSKTNGLNFPTDKASGRLNIRAMSPEQKEQYAALRAENPELLALDALHMDTRARQDAIRRMQDSGKYSQGTMEAIAKNVTGRFSSLAPGATGADRQVQEMSAVNQQLEYDKTKTRQMIPVGTASPEYNEAYATIASTIKERLDIDQGNNPLEDAGAMLTQLNKFKQNGVIVQGRRYQVPPDIIDLAIAQASPGFWRMDDATRAKDFRRIVTEAMGNPDILDRVAETPRIEALGDSIARAKAMKERLKDRGDGERNATSAV